MKRLTIFATILLSVICIMTSVYAAGTFNITAQTRENEFNKNSEFTMEFTLSGMQVGEGIITIGATLEYDKDSLEIVRTEGQNGWKMTYNDDTRIVFLENDALIKDNGALFTITFKVKESSKPNLTIKLKDITAGGPGEDISALNVEKAIVIKTDDSNNGGNNSDDNNNGDNSNGGNGSEDNNNGNNSNGNNNNGNDNNQGNGNNGNNNGNNNSGINNGNSNNNNENSKPNTTISTNDNNQSGSTTNGNNGAKIPQAGENDTVLFVLIGAAVVSAVIFFVKSVIAKRAEK